MQESESEERRYRFVSQQDYIQHLAVSRDLEMADAVRNVGRVLGNAWKVKSVVERKDWFFLKKKKKNKTKTKKQKKPIL